MLFTQSRFVSDKEQKNSLKLLQQEEERLPKESFNPFMYFLGTYIVFSFIYTLFLYVLIHCRDLSVLEGYPDKAS